MKLRRCRYCNDEYPADEPELWHSTFQCVECHRTRQREREAERRETWKIELVRDELIAPPRVKAQGNGPCLCRCRAECERNVQVGRQVLCGPVYYSDILIEKAYQERMAKA